MDQAKSPNFITQIYDKTTSDNSLIFIDRDGTIIEDVDFLKSKDQVKLLPNASKAIKMLNTSEHNIVVITNQAVVAGGWLTEKELKELNDYIQKIFKTEGANISAIYSCPHHPDATLSRYRINCECRKPEIGMFKQASHDLKMKLDNSYMIGDRNEDILAGKKLRIPTFMINNVNEEVEKVDADFYVDDILSAARIITKVKKL